MPECNGQPLPPALRREMERAFGADFSDIRVHAASSKPVSVGAKAYASGEDVYVAPGAYDPSSPESKALLAHELAHVVQQRGRSPGSGSNAERALDEREAAERAAGAIEKIGGRR